MTKKSKFLTWFVAQHGDEPVKTRAETERLQRSVLAGKIAQTRLHLQSDYEMKKTSALYGWNASRNPCPYCGAYCKCRRKT